MAVAVVFAIQVLLLFTAERVALVFKYWSTDHTGGRSMLWVMLTGLRMDLPVAFCLTIPVLLVNAAVPERILRRRWVRWPCWAPVTSQGFSNTTRQKRFSLRCNPRLQIKKH